MRVGKAIAFVLGSSFILWAGSTGQSQTPKTAENPAPLRDLFLELDTNGDQTIEHDEVPESGLQAFRTLLKYGDADHNGKLELAEYRNLMTNVNWAQALTPEQRERRLKMLDKDRDGRLSPTEFQGGPARFEQLDRNHDGFLSRDEIPWLNPDRPLPKSAPGPLAKTKGAERPLLERLKAMDKDGDGRVSREEFKGRPVMFDRLDLNHDGFIDQADHRERKAEVAK
jgi:Ca2+-binding EF-hand superfamily protein